jgi:hypothetical protein
MEKAKDLNTCKASVKTGKTNECVHEPHKNPSTPIPEKLHKIGERCTYLDGLDNIG